MTSHVINVQFIALRIDNFILFYQCIDHSFKSTLTIMFVVDGKDEERRFFSNIKQTNECIGS